MANEAAACAEVAAPSTSQRYADLGGAGGLWVHRRPSRWVAQRGHLTAMNDEWRICFEFRKGDAHAVKIVDYHKG
jgi:hypothetical protein